MRLARRLGFVALLFLAPAAFADEGSPLAQVPEQAPVVFHIHGFGRTKNRVVTLAKNAAPDLGAAAEAQVDQAMNKVFEGRKLQGVPADGAIFFALLEMPQPGEKDPPMAVIAQVTNYTEFRDGFCKDEERKSLKKEDGYETAKDEKGETTYFIDRKGYAVLTNKKDAAEKLMKKPERGLDAKLGEDARRFLEPDVGLWVDVVAINKAYGGAIQPFKKQMLDAVEQMGPLFAQGNEGAIELAKAMFAGVFQALEDGQSALVSLEFRPEGVALHVQARFGGDTQTARALKPFKTAEFKQLGRLPAGDLFYWGMETNPQVAERLMPLAFGVMAGKGENGDAVRSAIKDIAAAGPSRTVSSANVPTSGLGVWQFKDPEKAVAAQIKLLESLGAGSGFGLTPLKDKPHVKTNARTYRDFKLNHVKLAWDLDKLGAAIPGAPPALGDSMKKMMGEGLDIWFGTDGKTLVQVSGKNWETAKRSLDAYFDQKETLGEQQAFNETRKQLPERASALVLIDVIRYMQLIGDVFRGQLGQDAAPAAAVKGKPSYMGMAVTLQSGIGAFDLWFPASAVGEIRKAAGTFRPPADGQ